MIVKNGGNKLFLMCNSLSSKGSRAKHSQNQGTNFSRVYRSSVMMKLDAKRCILLSCWYIRLKDEFFSHVSVIFTVDQNEWLQLTAKMQFSIILRNIIGPSCTQPAWFMSFITFFYMIYRYDLHDFQVLAG